MVEAIRFLPFMKFCNSLIRLNHSPGLVNLVTMKVQKMVMKMNYGKVQKKNMKEKIQILGVGKKNQMMMINRLAI